MKTHPPLTVSWIVFLLALAASLADLAAADAKPEKPAQKTSAETASPQHLGKLIRQLGDRDYYARERAQDELLRLGFQAFDAVDAATTDADLEIASRAKYLLRLMRIDWTTADDSREVKRILRNYEYQGGGARQMAMRALAYLPGGQGAAALCRLVRYEKSSLLSKTAALALLSSGNSGRRGEPRAPSAATRDAVRKTLQGCKRPAAVWLLAWTRLADEPDAVLAEWEKSIAQERELLRQSSSETDAEIVSDLIYFQTTWLKKLDKKDAAKNAVRQLLEVETGDVESLCRLTPWLIEQKEWTAIDDLNRRFANRFAKDPCLLYLLAEASAEKGDKEKAEATASRALGLSPEKQQDALFQHLRAGGFLQNRGRFAWARREYEHVVANGNARNDGVVMYARTMFSEMLHDQGQDLDAANVIEKLARGIESGRFTEDNWSGRKPQEICSRYYYFLACHWESKHDLAKQREFLHKALRADPEDVDALIASYHLPDEPKADRAKILDSIRKAAATLHDAINEDVESASPYNQYAWLVGNTEGDLDEALRCSRKSLELDPEQPAYLDTLSHVYFTRGEYAEAVKCQEKAVEREPHSGLLRRALERFRAKLNEKKP